LEKETERARQEEKETERARQKEKEMERARQRKKEMEETLTKPSTQKCLSQIRASLICLCHHNLGKWELSTN